MGGIGSSVRQMLKFARPWERVLLGVVLFVVATALQSYVLAALGLVIVGVTVLGVVRARRGTTAGTGDGEGDGGTGTGAETGSDPATGSERGEP